MRKSTLILALASLIVVAMLFTACNQPTQPVDGPYPADDGGYPEPNTGGSPENPVANTPYPGNDPGTPGSTPPGLDPLAPFPGEEDMQRGEAFIEESDIVIMESFPPQYLLHLVGNLPTPCHYLRAKLNEPDAQNQILVEVYTVFNSDEVCAQTLHPFEVNLNLGSYKTGKYAVLINGERVGEIDAP